MPYSHNGAEVLEKEPGSDNADQQELFHTISFNDTNLYRQQGDRG